MSRAKHVISIMDEMEDKVTNAGSVAGQVTSEKTPEVAPVVTAAAPAVTATPATAAPAEAPKNPAADSEIKTGAKVKIIAGDMKDMIGNVVNVRGDVVDLKVGNTTKVGVPVQNIKPVV